MTASKQPKRNSRSQRRPLADPRLLGRWQSDRRRTFQTISLHRATPAALRKFKSLFGKLIVTWGPTTVTSELGDYKDTSTYKIIARNEHSIVVKISGAQLPLFGNIQQLHFEGDHYGVHAGEIIEWFRKIKN
jgi:hypothetical protein